MISSVVVNRKDTQIRLSIFIILLILLLIYPFDSNAGTSDDYEKIDAFVEVSLPSSGFVGESIVYDVFFYCTSSEVSDLQLNVSPGFGTLQTITGTSSNKNVPVVKKKGKSYYKWNAGRYFIIPDKAGSFTITGGKYVAYIPHERVVRDPWWGLRRVVDYEKISIVSEDKKIKFRPLPDVSNRLDFSGAVGEYSVVAWLPPGKISKDSEALAIIKVSGFGYLKDVEFPGLKDVFTGDSRLKKIERKEEITQRDGKLYSEIIFECSFIPLVEKGEIEEFSFCFFDTKSGKYRTVVTEPQPWNNEDEYTPVDKSKLQIIEI